MKPETKLAIRRWTIRKLRLLFDWLDDRLHAAEVELREECSATRSGASVLDAGEPRTPRLRSGNEKAAPENFAEWEMRRAGIVHPKPKPRRHSGRLSSREFDLRFSQ